MRCLACCGRMGNSNSMTRLTLYGNRGNLYGNRGALYGNRSLHISMLILLYNPIIIRNFFIFRSALRTFKKIEKRSFRSNNYLINGLLKLFILNFRIIYSRLSNLFAVETCTKDHKVKIEFGFLFVFYTA